MNSVKFRDYIDLPVVSDLEESFGLSLERISQKDKRAIVAVIHLSCAGIDPLEAVSSINKLFDGTLAALTIYAFVGRLVFLTTREKTEIADAVSKIVGFQENLDKQNFGG